MASASPICLMARASSTKSWLWHQRSSHLNFDTVNDLAKNDLVIDLPKFKYHKEHLCPSREQGKSKRASHPPKPVPNSRRRLHHLHMDLCGPMRIASINGVQPKDKKIMETMNVSFDELSAMAFEQRMSTMEPKNVKEAMTDPAWIKSMQEELLQFKRLDVWVLVPAPDNITPLTLKWLFKNEHDEEKTVIRNKSRLVVRGYRQKEGIDFEESFASVYVDDIIFGSTHPRYTQLFFDLMKSRFEMSMMEKMTFFLGLQLNQSPCGIFLNQSKYVLEIFKIYGMESCDPVGTPMEIKYKLNLDQNETPVYATKYRSMIGALMGSFLVSLEKLNVSQMISQDMLIDFYQIVYGFSWQYPKDRPTVVSQGVIRRLRLSHSEIVDIEKVAVRSSLRVPNNKCALIESRANEIHQKSH
nr:ribonuclease H-like domain-containing protein [Tanacetum cinerariifolium]